MPKDTVVPKLKIKHKGFFDLSELYKNIKGWLDYNGFGDEEKNFQEVSYSERIKGEAKQIESKWVAQKNVDDYFANHIEITFAVLGLVEAEAEKQGKRIKTQKGEIEITLKASLIKDRSDSWSPLMRKIYENLVVGGRISSYKTNFYGQVYGLHDEIKAFLEMDTY